MARRGALPIALVAITLGAGAFGLRPVSTPDAFPPRAAVRAAVLSPRRVPALLSSAIAHGRLAGALDRFLADPALGGGRDNSCLVVDDRGQRVYERKPTRALTPASTLKLLTGAAALRRLGAGATFQTTVVATAPLRDGVIDGDVWIVGGGDPLLSTADYDPRPDNAPRAFSDINVLARNMRSSGVRGITGRVLGDESRYDTERYLASWPRGYTAGGNIGSLSALAVNDGFVRWRPDFAVDASPATHAASMFVTALGRAGVDVAGEPGRGTAPKAATKVAAMASLPLRTIIGEMLIHSDNETAELLTKELGFRFGGGGTTSAGVTVIRKTLADAGFSVADVATTDGSGLDGSDKLPCTVLAELLASSDGKALADAGLSVAAQGGTMFDQFVGNPAAGRLRAKTGALEGVVGLAGFMDQVEDRPPLTFAFIANSLPAPSHDRGERAQERLGAALAAYPDAPTPDSLAP